MPIAEEVRSACRRVEELVGARNEDDFYWEDAIAELGLSQEMGVIVLAMLFASLGGSCASVQSQVRAFLH